eukprot:7871815-Pyramimonas_sp.AAC.1
MVDLRLVSQRGMAVVVPDLPVEVDHGWVDSLLVSGPLVFDAGTANVNPPARVRKHGRGHSHPAIPQVLWISPVLPRGKALYMENVIWFYDTIISLGQEDSVIRPTELYTILHGLAPIYDDDN